MDEIDTFGATLHDADFERICALIYEAAGISLSDAKRDLVRSRLGKRLRARKVDSYAAYLKLLHQEGPHSQEMQEFINCLTTNKTDFFREKHHFDYLKNVVIAERRAARVKRLRVWCSASSTGEEPYTLAMTLREACPVSEGWDLKILASDIDTNVLKHAEQGIYDDDRAVDIPENYLKKYFLKGTGANAGKIAARKELRDILTFRRINLMDDVWPIKTKFDVIFCRNVVIYFNRECQHRLLTRFHELLTPEGYLFMGHSESLYWISEKFAPISTGGTIYRPRGAGGQTPPSHAGLRVPSKNGSLAEHKANGRSTIVEPPKTPRTPKAIPSQVPIAIAGNGKTDKRSLPSKQVPGLQERTIILGEVEAIHGPGIVKTLLGSCVAACLWDPETGIGGMNHFSLPGVGEPGGGARYGAHAMELLITSMMKLGADRNRFKAKVFGGAKVIKVDSERMNIGAKNAAFVEEYLTTEGIPIIARSLGGTSGLVVRFRTDTGQAFVRPLSPVQQSEVLDTEKVHLQTFEKKVTTPQSNDIELF